MGATKGGGSGSSTPTGPAGGVLSGTYPNPGKGAFDIVNADVDAAAAIAKSKLAALDILNADVDAAAAIVYSKLALTGSIVNADIAAGAAIAKAKLANLDIVNADVDAAAAIAKTKLAALDIVNADVDAAAGIAVSKLAVITGNVAANGAITSGTGFTVNHVGTGHYTVTFTSAFASVPAVLISQIQTALSSNSIAVNPLAGSFDVFSQTGGVGAVDAAFEFIACLIH